MYQNRVEMSVRKVSEAVRIIDIQGEINRYAENALLDAYAQANTGNSRILILNFNRMDYMNSSGIGLLVTLLIRTQRQGQQLLAYGLNEHYRQIFELTRLNEAIRIYESEEKALEAASAFEEDQKK